MPPLRLPPFTPYRGGIGLSGEPLAAFSSDALGHLLDLPCTQRHRASGHWKQWGDGRCVQLCGLTISIAAGATDIAPSVVILAFDSVATLCQASNGHQRLLFSLLFTSTETPAPIDSGNRATPCAQMLLLETCGTYLPYAGRRCQMARSN